MPPREARLATLSFFAISVVVAALLLFAPMRDVFLRFVHDDAFYYFGVARRWSRQGFPTFDGIDATNGYHPLWQWLLSVWSRAISDPGSFARTGAAFGVLFFGIGTWLVARRLARQSNPFGALAYAWVAGTLLLATIYGMESPLAALLLAIGIAVAPRRRDEFTLPCALACSTATSLLFMARLDALPWPASLDALLVALAVVAVARDRRRMMPLIGFMCAVQLVVVAGYFVGNWLTWGHVLSISAALKAARAPLFSLAVPRSLLFVLALGVAGLGILPLVEFFRALRERDSDRAWELLTPAWLALANLGYLAAIAAKGDRETYNWYFTLTVFSGAYLLPVCLERYAVTWTGLSRRTLARWSLAACLILLAISLRSKITSPSFFVGAYDKATALASFPEDSLVLAATDCGILGYFSRQRVITLDGLTNSWDFQNALAEDRLAEWLADRGVSAYVGPPAPNDGVAFLAARAGLSSAPQTLRLRVAPMPGVSPASGGATVWRVAKIER